MGGDMHINCIHMIAEMSISISDKMEFKIKKITTNKEGHFIMIKCLIN